MGSVALWMHSPLRVPSRKASVPKRHGHAPLMLIVGWRGGDDDPSAPREGVLPRCKSHGAAHDALEPFGPPSRQQLQHQGQLLPQEGASHSTQHNQRCSRFTGNHLLPGIRPTAAAKRAGRRHASKARVRVRPRVGARLVRRQQGDGKQGQEHNWPNCRWAARRLEDSPQGEVDRERPQRLEFCVCSLHLQDLLCICTHVRLSLEATSSCPPLRPSVYCILFIGKEDALISHQTRAGLRPC